MEQSKLNTEWDEMFGRNLFEKLHSTYIENDIKTIDYLVNFTIDGIKTKLDFALFVQRDPSQDVGYLIEEKTISYQDLFFSQLKRNADFVSKIHFSDFKVKHMSDYDKNNKTLENISSEAKRELLLETEFEETLYRLYLALIFPSEVFRPTIIYVPAQIGKMREKEIFLYVYTHLEK